MENAINYWLKELSSYPDASSDDLNFYKDIENEKYKILLSKLHHNFLHLFQRMNEQLPTGACYGRYWAAESRQLKKMIEASLDLVQNLRSTSLPLEIDEYYHGIMQKCDLFLCNSYGSDIPPNMQKIRLPLSTPIFRIKSASTPSKQEPMTAQPKYRIFISHASTDRGFITPLTDLLQQAFALDCSDITYTSSPETGIKNFSNFNNSLRKSIEKSTLAIIFLTNNYLKSQYCICELGALWGLQKKCFLFNADGITKGIMPDILQNATYDGLTPSALDKLYDTLTGELHFPLRAKGITEWNAKKERTMDVMLKAKGSQSTGTISQRSIEIDAYISLIKSYLHVKIIKNVTIHGHEYGAKALAFLPYIDAQNAQKQGYLQILPESIVAVLGLKTGRAHNYNIKEGNVTPCTKEDAKVLQQEGWVKIITSEADLPRP